MYGVESRGVGQDANVVFPPEAARRSRRGGRYSDLQREALRRRRMSRNMMAASLLLLVGLFALFCQVLSG